MAWAAITADGSATSVALTREHLGTDGQTIEIPDEVALQILDGSRPLAYCFNDPPPKQQGSRIRYNTRYPSMMPERDVDALIALARLIPTKGVAVEIGSRMGGSAKCILEHADQLTRMYCIDIEWQGQDRGSDHDPLLDDIMQRFDMDRNLTSFEHASALLRPWRHVRLLKSNSPYGLAWWSEKVDFVFEDSSHINPQLRDNLDFWWQHIKTGGILSGHDFNPRWPDVYAEVQDFGARHGLDLKSHGTIWWFFKP